MQTTLSDFNDLHVIFGLDKVTQQLKKAAHLAKTPTKEFMEKFDTIETLKTQDTKAAAKALDAHEKQTASHTVIKQYINGVQPLAMKIGKSGNPIPPPEFTAANALWKYYEGRTVVSEESLFLYETTHWREVDKYMEGKIKLQIQVLYDGLASNSKLENTWKQFLNLVPKAPRNLFDPNPFTVNFQNGTVHIYKKETWLFDFRPHNKEDYCTAVIPINYDVTRKIRNTGFEEMLERIFDGQADKAEKLRAIKQMYGACVAPIFPHLFMIHGPGGSGKSSIIIPAQRLIHKDNWCSVEPHEFEGFKMESMAGKLVNIVTDINLDVPIRDNHVKKIEDSIPVRIDRKFKNAILVPLPKIHIFGGNDIPATFEKGSGAHERRWTFLHVEGFKALGLYSKNFANEVFDLCPEGVLNFALDGLEEVLRDNGHYFTPVSGKEKMKEWQEAYDPVALFVQEIINREIKSLEMKADGRVKRSEVWPIFVAWYRFSYNKAARISKSKFYDALPKVRGTQIPVQNKIVEGVRYFSGLSVTKEVDPWPVAGGSIGSAN